uniref:(northern house mosquito) hypothetical protein n=1 Tax=Culex pipiens TaxID=7175 RepID=A0A8D8HJ51_CULPI
MVSIHWTHIVQHHSSSSSLTGSQSSANTGEGIGSGQTQHPQTSETGSVCRLADSTEQSRTGNRPIHAAGHVHTPHQRSPATGRPPGVLGPSATGHGQREPAAVQNRRNARITGVEAHF